MPMVETVYVDYETADLLITVAVERLENAPSVVLTAARMFDEYCGAVRSALRDYRSPLAPYLPMASIGGASVPIFRVGFIKRGGTSREIDQDLGLEVLRMRFTFDLYTLPASAAVSEIIVEAKERHLTKAVQDLFKASNIPDTFIPEDVGTRGNTWIDIVTEMGPEQNRGPMNYQA